jgi:asparagine synthetase B (glutamine-hydrolysing)
MCGFTGIFSKDKIVSTDINKSTDSILHRGPDMRSISFGFIHVGVSKPH